MTEHANAKVSAKELSNRLSQRLASFKLGDEVINRLAARIVVEDLSIAKFDVCAYGICVDYFTPKVPRLDSILRGKDVARLDVFPYGIIEWDRFHVRVGLIVNELEGRGASRGFVN